MTDASCREPLDGALRAATIIGHWKLVIGHLIRMIHASLRELSGLGMGVGAFQCDPDRLIPAGRRETQCLTGGFDTWLVSILA